MSGLSIAKLILIFLPFIVSVILAGRILFTSETRKNKLNKILNTTTKSVEEKSVTKIIADSVKSKAKFIDKQNAKLNMLGIEHKFETLASISVVLFIVGAIVSHLLFKAGIFLMIYLGGLLAMSIFMRINSQLEKRKKELTIEFLEKMRDVATFLSVGKSLNNAISEAIESGNISNVMYRELDNVRKEIFTGRKISDSFMIMYDRLQIEDIKMYAETLSTFEETGGNLITVMKANDQFATSKLEIRNAQNIFAESQKSSQKVVVGIPASLIIGFSIFNPSFFGNFYSTFIGQVIAIVCISVLLFGVTMSNKLAKID